MAKLFDAPCTGCGNRYMGCHSHCEAYKSYTIRQEAFHAEQLREGMIENDTVARIGKKTKHRTNKWGGGAQ